MARAYWVTLVDGTHGCVELVEDEAPKIEGDYKQYKANCVAAIERKVAALFNTRIETIDTLPYPASPRWGSASDCPPFCYTPVRCAGRVSCPKSHACDD